MANDFSEKVIFEIEIYYYGGFRIANFKNDLKNSEFKMVDTKWQIIFQKSNTFHVTFL